MSSITRSLSEMSTILGINISKARNIPRTDFGSVLRKRALMPIPRYSAADIGVLVLANELLEAGLSKPQVMEHLSSLPPGDSIDAPPEQWEIDRLLAIVAEFQDFSEEQRMEFKGSQKEVGSRLEELDHQLKTVGDDAQLANLDLQNALQKQQQTLQLLSNINKMLHDTMMAILRKIG